MRVCYRGLFWSLFCFFLVSNTGKSQTIELGIGLGLAGYDGDILSDKPEVFKTISGGGQIQLSSYFGSRFRAQISYNRGKVSASDAKITGADRNLSFSTVINELGARLFLHLIPFDPAGESGRKFTFYGGSGITVFHYNPYTIDFQGHKVFLRDAGTAGQFSGSENGRKKPYSLYQIGVPLTMGFSVAVRPELILGLEFDYRVLFTDYLDDIAQDRYPDFNELLVSDPGAALLTNRGWEREYEKGGYADPIHAARDYYEKHSLQGKFRSSGNYNDAFGFILFKISYLLEDFSIGGNKKFGCYNF